MSYQVFVQEPAELDLEDAYNWYEERSRGLGSEFIWVVDASLADIGRYPLANPLIYRQIRQKRLRRFPYNLFYYLDGETIFIVACFHARRDPQQWQRRI